MAEDQDEFTAGDNPSNELSEEEQRDVGRRKTGSARVVHEVIRLQGEDELSRPWLSLLLSGLAAGVAITASVLGEALLAMDLPATKSGTLLASFGYALGFLIVIMGKLQLFTENTVTAVLPLVTHFTRRNIARLARLWAVVLLGNLAGTLLVAVLIAQQIIVSAAQFEAVMTLAQRLASHDAVTVLWLGMPAGFLVASIAWIMPNARSSEFWIILSLTFLIALGGFSHVVAGSCEAWLLWLTGAKTLGWTLGGFIAPALIGNIIGGTGLFALLAHGQVRGEI
ncbi:formate/nitrite transporter family protein [Sphingomonas morindae]|uniref:Formate/nitrite transporter family protein n=1 Tax=Sphingomonas morindae TaxID=1541170 RepID=A0ABY4X5M6_9SPHN|nr:formate/nitrite transporter family protein [Sphingomonas morindae]USI72135.1 formate/nitrite transporter family protein [Sphingomonas morindae]